MANSEERSRPPTIIPWNPMLKKWTWYTGQNAQFKVQVVKKFFNTFIPNHPGYRFTIVQIYNGLWEVAITNDQYHTIKNQLERMVGLTLPEITGTDFLEESTTMRSFNNLNEFRRYQDNDLRAKNRMIVREKAEEAKQHHNRVMEIFTKPRKKVILAFDIEAFEYNFSKMLEIGYTQVRFSPNARGGLPEIEVMTNRHLVIEENLQYKNKDFVPDNRDGFKFGSSDTVSQAEAVEAFRMDVIKSDALLGHGVAKDDDYLRRIGVDLSTLNKEILDSQLIEMHKNIKPNDDRFITPGLKRLLEEYKVNFKEKDLHNAGNDAFYTMMLFLCQMGYSTTTVNHLSRQF